MSKPIMASSDALRIRSFCERLRALSTCNAPSLMTLSLALRSSAVRLQSAQDA